MLVTGNAKTAIAEFAYCGTMYQEALKTIERKFVQPHAVASSHLDKLSGFPLLKMHNSENVIAFSATTSALSGFFRSFKNEHDLSSAALLEQAVQIVSRTGRKLGLRTLSSKIEANQPSWILTNG